MIISYHNYRLNNELFITGANYHYIENTKLLHERKPDDIKLISHDFRNLVLGKEKPPKLTKEDVLLSNVGPYAHVYHYLREKHNLKFRIIRDVQTGLWPGYLFQEKICNRYMKEGDKVMFLSEFARQLYIKLFPKTLNEENTFVCAPFMYFFPKKVKKEKKEDDNLTLGWVGRVTGEKNFYQALEAFIRLNKELDNVKFIVAGDSSNKIKLEISKKLKENKIKENDFIYVNKSRFIPHKNVWEIYNKMDVFLFPSLSINESLGRTIVEACYMNVPVVAPYHGAAPELLNEKNLISVKYRDDLFQLDSVRPYSFGKVDMDDFINKLYNYKSLSRENDISKYSNHYKKFFNVLCNIEPKKKLAALKKQVKDFIDRVHFHNNSMNLNMKQIMSRTKWFVTGKTDNRRLTIKKSDITGNKYKIKLTYNKENYYILNQYNFFLSAFLNYNPYASLNKEIPKIKLQKFITYLKKPFKKSTKMAYYFYLKHKYVSTYPSDFNFKSEEREFDESTISGHKPI